MLTVVHVRSHMCDMDAVAADVAEQAGKLIEQHQAYRATPLLGHTQVRSNGWYTAHLVLLLEGPPPTPPSWLQRLNRLNSEGRPYICDFQLKDGTELNQQGVYGFHLGDREIRMSTFDTTEALRTVRVDDVLACKVEVLD